MNNSTTPLSETSLIILQEAQKEFSKYGFYNCNVDRIAKAAGVGKGTIYRHFGDKEHLFKAVFENFMKIFLNTLNDKDPTGDLREDLLFIINSVLTKMHENRDFFKVGIHYQSHFIEKHKDDFIEKEKMNIKKMNTAEKTYSDKVFNKAIENKKISGDIDFALLESIYWSYIHGVIRDIVITQLPFEQIKKYSIVFIDIFCDGINKLYPIKD